MPQTAAKRRERYASDPELRARCVAESRARREANPDGNAAACAANYAANRMERSAAQRGRESERQDRLNALKAQPCTDCGVQHHPAVMEFDHVRGEKLYAISSARMNREDLADELAKCELRCANCHRLRHALKREATTTKRTAALKPGRGRALI